MVIPLRTALLDRATGKHAGEHLLVLTEAEQSFRFEGFAALPVLSINRGFSAPVAIDTERRYFYGAAWAMCITQPIILFLWKVLPDGRAGDVLKLVVFLAVATFVGWLSYRGRLPRTRPIVPGELAVSD